MTVSFHKFGEYFPGTGDVKDVGEIETALKISPTLPRYSPLSSPVQVRIRANGSVIYGSTFVTSFLSRCGPGEELRDQLSSR